MQVLELENVTVCAYCGKSGDKNHGPNGLHWHIDHVIPKSKYLGKISDKSNLVRSCSDCNSEKADLVGIWPLLGTPYGDGSIHSPQKEKELSLMINDELELLTEPRNSTDINIRQATEIYDVSSKTIRRAIANGDIDEIYKVKGQYGPEYYFPESSIKKIWGESTTKDKNISLLETEVSTLSNELTKIQALAKSQAEEILRLKEKINIMAQIVIEKI